MPFAIKNPSEWREALAAPPLRGGAAPQNTADLHSETLCIELGRRVPSTNFQQRFSEWGEEH